MLILGGAVAGSVAYASAPEAIGPQSLPATGKSKLMHAEGAEHVGPDRPIHPKLAFASQATEP